MLLARCALVVGCFSLAGPLDAAEWGHWRGPDGNGVASEATPPIEWSDTKNVKWKLRIPGRGSGSPIVWGDRVFVATAVSQKGSTGSRVPSREPLEFVLMSLDRQTGKIQWRQTALATTPHGPTHSTNSYASASPCTDGEYVYAHFGSEGIYCFTIEGEPVWDRDLGNMTTRAGFGEGSSPTLADDKLIVPWDHEGQSYLFALDKRTGDILWQTPRDEPTCWATPLVIEHQGKQQVIMNGQNYARAYDLETGDELWRCGGQAERPVASPVAEGGLVFVGSGHRGSFLGAFTPDGSGDIEGSKSVVWTVGRNTPDIGSPVLSDGRLYFYKGKTGLLSCVDAKTGEPHYLTKRTGLRTIYASPVVAGGHVYLTDRDGKTVVIEDSEQFNIVAENSVGETVDATPAPVGDQLFIRGERHLFCIQE